MVRSKYRFHTDDPIKARLRPIGSSRFRFAPHQQVRQSEDRAEVTGAQVITPYFTWSDGRTRSWTDVWGGSTKPWLVSVEAPYDVGKNLYGHGVGMSAWDQRTLGTRLIV